MAHPAVHYGERVIQASICQARESGDLETWQFPVTMIPPQQAGGHAQAHWKPFPFKILKDLKQAIGQYGPNSPYVQTLLQTVAYDKCLCPYDWETLAQPTLSPSQFLQFKVRWTDEATNRVHRNARSQLPVNITSDPLLRIVQAWDIIEQQIMMNDEAIA